MPRRTQEVSEAPGQAAGWISTSEEERGFARYLEIVWGGRWIILIAVVAAIAGAVIYVQVAPKVYQAHASLLVTPVPPTDTVSGLGLIEASSDPLRDIETGAGFVTTTSVAQRVKALLHDSRSPEQLLQQVQANPIAESDTVDVAATDDTAKGAQRLANSFVFATVVDRTAVLQQQLATLIPALQARVAALGTGGAVRAGLGAELAQLESLRQGGTPNLRVLAPADLPTSPTSPRKTLTVVAAAFGGLVLGVGLVFMIQLLDPRLRREEDLRERFKLPILARVPKAPRSSRRRGRGPLSPEIVAPEATDAYHTLRSVLTSVSRSGTRTRGGRIVLVTGPSPQDGKSTTSLNLAAALAASSSRVILVEADLRRPSIGRALDIRSEEGLESVLYGEVALEEALVPVQSGTNELDTLLASRNGAAAQPLSPSAFNDVLLAAREISDWVVVDAPPLLYAPDLLSGSRLFDAVLLVVRLGNTNLGNLEEIAETLAQHGIKPAGFVVVGTTGRPQYY